MGHRQSLIKKTVATSNFEVAKMRFWPQAISKLAMCQKVMMRQNGSNEKNKVVDEQPLGTL